MGPSDDESLQREFDALWRRRNEVSADCFFVAEGDSEHVRRDIEKRLTKRGLKYPEECQTMSWDLLCKVLPPGAVQRLEQYKSTRARAARD